MNSTIEDLLIIEIPKIQDPRGNIGVIEKEILPYKIKRVYYLYDVPSHASRGGHAHKELVQCLIALSGSFKVVLKDGENTKEVVLNKPDKGLLIPSGIWREICDFSSGAICLVMASEVYRESDYIRDFNVFLKHKKA